MEMLAVTSPNFTSQQASSQTQATSKANGTAPFQQQLSQYVNEADNSTASTKLTETSTEANVTVVENVQADITTLNVDQLVALIEKLIEQIDELTDVPLTDEDVNALEGMSMQLIAVLQLITNDNQILSDVIGQFTQTSPATISESAKSQLNNDLLFKLQDQLLLLQQVLKDGQLKVTQGQQPEQLLSQVASQLKQLLDSTRQNSKEQLIQQITNQVSETDGALVDDLRSRSIEQLKPLAKQAEYAQLANQVQATATTVVNQTVEMTPVINLSNTVPFSAQFVQSTSMLNGQSQAPAFTMVNQFADTVKTMVLQKFDLNQLTNGISQARIMLTPEHLGSVDIRLSMQNGVLTAVFSAETVMAKEALENQMSVLRSTLAVQGITVERMEVTQASFNDELSWEQQRQQQANAENQQDDAHEDSFEEQLEANAVNQELGFGRAVNEMV